MTSQALDFESNNNRVILTWTNIKPYLDGTLATLKFHYIEYPNKYFVVTEKYGTFCYACTLNRDAGPDVTDFENNFQALSVRDPMPLPVEGESVVSGGSADNSSNSTSKVPVIAARANASAPSWTEGNMVPLSVDNAGALRISGSISATNPSVSTTGSAPPASATYIGGSVTTSAPSYTNGQMAALSLDTSGALRVSGTTATTNLSVGSTGSAILTYATNLGASDGTNLVQLSALNSSPSGSEYGLVTRNIPYGTQSVSASSLPLPTGAATESTLSAINTKTPALGQATMANSSPVVIASDQSAVPVSDNGGSLTVDGTVAATQSGSWTVTADAGTGPWPITDNGGSITVDGTVSVTTSGGEEATYTAIAQNTTVGNNKSMLGIFNPSGSGYILKIREIYIRNTQTAAVTGVVGFFELRAIRGVGANITGGTDVTPISHDSNDALPSGIICKTGGTVTSEISPPLDRMGISTDEWGPGTLDVEASQQSVANYLPARSKRDGVLKPFIARAGEGLHMKFATNSTAGSFDIIFVFTKA